MIFLRKGYKTYPQQISLKTGEFPQIWSKIYFWKKFPEIWEIAPDLGQFWSEKTSLNEINSFLGHNPEI